MFTSSYIFMTQSHILVDLSRERTFSYILHPFGIINIFILYTQSFMHLLYDNTQCAQTKRPKCIRPTVWITHTHTTGKNFEKVFLPDGICTKRRPDRSVLEVAFYPFAHLGKTLMLIGHDCCVQKRQEAIYAFL